jgi:hypothetical protein
VRFQDLAISAIVHPSKVDSLDARAIGVHAVTSISVLVPNDVYLYNPVSSGGLLPSMPTACAGGTASSQVANQHPKLEAHFSSNGTIRYYETPAKCRRCTVVAWCVTWHAKGRPEQEIGAGEHSNKHMCAHCLALPHWMTSVASNEAFIHANGCCCIVMAQYVGWHTISR